MRTKGYYDTYRKEAIRTAEELHYSPGIIKKIQKAKTDNEITRILAEARRKDF